MKMYSEPINPEVHELLIKMGFVPHAVVTGINYYLEMEGYSVIRISINVHTKTTDLPHIIFDAGAVRKSAQIRDAIGL